MRSPRSRCFSGVMVEPDKADSNTMKKNLNMGEAPDPEINNSEVFEDPDSSLVVDDDSMIQLEKQLEKIGKIITLYDNLRESW